jgi:AraC family transcriptional regulator
MAATRTDRDDGDGGVLHVSGGALAAAQERPREAGGFIFTLARLPAGLSLPLHSHDRANLNIVLDGEYRERVGSRSYAHPRFSLIVKPPATPHENPRLDVAARCIVVELPAERLAAPGTESIFDDVRSLRSDATRGIALRIASELRRDDPAAPLALEALALEMLALAARERVRAHRGGRPRWLDRVIEMLESNRPPSVLELAAEVDLHPVYLARAFRAQLGSTIGAYARQRRVERACESLASTILPLSRIAHEAGFCDQSHFCAVFRRQMGVTPGEYRKLMRKG